LTVRLGEQSLAVGGEAQQRPALENFVGREVVVGIRPEDIEDAALSPSTPADRRLRTTTSLVESLGSEIIVHFPMPIEPFAIMDQEFEGEDAVAATTDDTGNYIYVARVNPRSRTRIGEAIELAVDTSRMHFFDPETGLAIRN
jgi:multiple sugar transport system ATP-binding protein